MGGWRPNYNQEGPRLFQLLGGDNDDDDSDEAAVLKTKQSTPYISLYIRMIHFQTQSLY